MDCKYGVRFRLIRVCNDFYDKEDMDDVRLPVNALIGFLSFEKIHHFLGAFSEGYGVYFCLVMEVLLSMHDVSANIFSKNKLGHVLINVRYHGWYRDDNALLLLNGDPDILRIGALVPLINIQGIGGSNELVRLGSCPHIVYVNLQVLG